MQALLLPLVEHFLLLIHVVKLDLTALLLLILAVKHGSNGLLDRSPLVLRLISHIEISCSCFAFLITDGRLIGYKAFQIAIQSCLVLLSVLTIYGLNSIVVLLIIRAQISLLVDKLGCCTPQRIFLFLLLDRSSLLNLLPAQKVGRT